jgi:hypothetical protein
MRSNAEYYRGRGLVAKQRAAHATNPSVKEALKDVARHWLALAERVDWLDRHHNSQQADKEPMSINKRRPRSGALGIQDVSLRGTLARR